MGEIKDYVALYVENSDILKEETNKIAVNLQNNIKKEAPYYKGRLKRSIRVDTRISKKFALITGYWDEGLAPHGIFVLIGVRGKAKVPKNDFLGRGLLRTLEAYS